MSLPDDFDVGLEPEIDRLYALPLSEFISARDELAKRVREDGRREQAEHVKSLRKPPAAVWLVNQLARGRELDVQRLLKAGEALTESQVKAAKGSSSGAFLEARREEHRALARLTEAAREMAEEEGLGASAVDRATQTLRAASVTREGRELLKRGRLTEELQPPGFEALADLPAAPRSSGKKQAPRPRQGEREERRRALKAAREQLRHLRQEERELGATARAAERDAERGEREASVLRKQAEDARAKAEAAAVKRAVAERNVERFN